MRNRYPGRCVKCGRYVQADEGYFVGGQGVFCEADAPGTQAAVPAAPREPIIVLDLRDNKAFVKAEGYLGDRFDAFRTATQRAGCKFEYSTKGNVCSLEAASRLIQELAAVGLKVDVKARLVDAMQGRVEQVKTEVQAAGSRLDSVDAQLAKRGLSLFEYQREGVRWLSPRIGALLADGMGVGKTIQAITSLPDNAPVVVVCPSVVKGVWRNEIAKWRPELKTVILEGRGSFRWPAPNEAVIINYDILPAAPDPKKEGSGDPVAEPPPGTVIVADEAHAVKSGTAKRTRALKRLTTMVQKSGGRAWLLTGTPLVNRPPELWSVLNCAGLGVETFSNWNNFVRLFNGYKNRWGGYEWGDPMSEVPELLKRVMLRRVKADVLKDLPEKLYQNVPVEIDAKYAREIEKTLKAQGTTVEAVIDAIEAAAAETGKIPFERYSAVREILARAKYASLVEFLEPYEEAAEPVIVFSAHLWPVQTLVEQKLSEGKRWGLITGADTPAAERTKIVEDFQAGKLAGIAMTIRAGGVGITLTKSNTVIFLDSSWSPADNEQAEDRAHRIGQTRGTTIVQMIANHPIDIRVHELLREKRELIEATTEAARTRPGESAKGAAEDIEAGLEAIRGLAPVSAQELAEAASRPVYKAAAPEPKRMVMRPAQTDVERWAVEGVHELILSDPDRARLPNQMGFNQADGEFGRRLSGTLDMAGGLTDKQWAALVNMLRKYWRQIGRPPDYVEPEKKKASRKATPTQPEA